MRKIIFLLTLLFIVFKVHSNELSICDDKKDLSDLAPIFNQDGTLYGYFSIEYLEKVNRKYTRYEYSILDTNLNQVIKGNFLEREYKKLTSLLSLVSKVDDRLIIRTRRINFRSYVLGYDKQMKAFNTYRSLNLSNNKISDPFYFDHNKNIVIGERPTKGLNDILKKSLLIEDLIPIQSGYITKERFIDDETKDIQPHVIRKYNLKNELVWKYTVNITRSKGDYFDELINSSNVLFSFNNRDNNTNTIFSLDPETGKELFKYEVENANSKANHTFTIAEQNDKLVVVGKMSTYHFKGYDDDKSLGLFRIVFEKNGKIVSKKYAFWNQAKNFIKIDKYGHTLDGFKLAYKKVFRFDDGSISILTEKQKAEKLVIGGKEFKTSSYQTAEFVLLNFNKDFRIQSIDVVNKNLSFLSRSDYLFSQKVRKKNGVVFFYKDQKPGEKDQKEWVLGIVTVVNGKLSNHEQIPISSEDYFIQPYIAKEGYILFREYNKDKNYDEVRLEKLNI
ncbi:hypothetical protein EV195_102141 [Tenacibaculum skagerrakense]|uniref:WG repeat protein n=1 Tax=Tenacibaculum skagerrakense TaxID=186571 RepID=A0A4R2NX67_9FLAO|nr:hypothetical protein [Tenacibaculum skagerrakense]TCP26799.1 hypothetical protein EV195_102141 [Tenacibaculum skagerrakense]